MILPLKIYERHNLKSCWYLYSNSLQDFYHFYPDTTLRPNDRSSLSLLLLKNHIFTAQLNSTIKSLSQIINLARTIIIIQMHFNMSEQKENISIFQRPQNTSSKDQQCFPLFAKLQQTTLSKTQSHTHKKRSLKTVKHTKTFQLPSPPLKTSQKFITQSLIMKKTLTHAPTIHFSFSSSSHPSNEDLPQPPLVKFSYSNEQKQPETPAHQDMQQSHIKTVDSTEHSIIVPQMPSFEFDEKKEQNSEVDIDYSDLDSSGNQSPTFQCKNSLQIFQKPQKQFIITRRRSRTVQEGVKQYPSLCDLQIVEVEPIEFDQHLAKKQENDQASIDRNQEAQEEEIMDIVPNLDQINLQKAKSSKGQSSNEGVASPISSQIQRHLQNIRRLKEESSKKHSISQKMHK